MIRFSIPGPPPPDHRHIPTIAAGRALMHPSTPLRKWRRDAGWFVRAAAPRDPLDEPLLVRIDLHAKRPQRVKGAGLRWHWHKPDADNVAKVALDLMVAHGFFVDDDCVCVLQVHKFYRAPGDQLPPRLDVTVAKLAELAQWQHVTAPALTPAQRKRRK